MRNVELVAPPTSISQHAVMRQESIYMYVSPADRARLGALGTGRITAAILIWRAMIDWQPLLGIAWAWFRRLPVWLFVASNVKRPRTRGALGDKLDGTR